MPKRSKLASQTLRAERRGALVVQVELPAGYHLNPAAPQRYRVSVESGQRQIGLSRLQNSAPSATTRLSASHSRICNCRCAFRCGVMKPGKAELRVQLTLFYCREDNTGTCRIKTLVWRVPVEVTNDPSAPAKSRFKARSAAD